MQNEKKNIFLSGDLFLHCETSAYSKKEEENVYVNVVIEWCSYSMYICARVSCDKYLSDSLEFGERKRTHTHTDRRFYWALCFLAVGFGFYGGRTYLEYPVLKCSISLFCFQRNNQLLKKRRSKIFPDLFRVVNFLKTFIWQR